MKAQKPAGDICSALGVLPPTISFSGLDGKVTFGTVAVLGPVSRRRWEVGKDLQHQQRVSLAACEGATDARICICSGKTAPGMQVLEALHTMHVHGSSTGGCSHFTVSPPSSTSVA
jgi:hypothetical protein